MDTEIEEKVLSILARRTGLSRNRLTLDARLVQDLGLDGDDAIDTLLEISKKCLIDLSEFDSSKYFRSEPSILSLLRSIFLRKKDQFVGRKSLTIKELILAVESGILLKFSSGKRSLD